MPRDDDEKLSSIKLEIHIKAAEALVRAKAALLDARLEVKKWEEFLREYKQSPD